MEYTQQQQQKQQQSVRKKSSVCSVTAVKPVFWIVFLRRHGPSRHGTALLHGNAMQCTTTTTFTFSFLYLRIFASSASSSSSSSRLLAMYSSKAFCKAINSASRSATVGGSADDDDDGMLMMIYEVVCREREKVLCMTEMTVRDGLSYIELVLCPPTTTTRVSFLTRVVESVCVWAWSEERRETKPKIKIIKTEHE